MDIMVHVSGREDARQRTKSPTTKDGLPEESLKPPRGEFRVKSEKVLVTLELGTCINISEIEKGNATALPLYFGELTYFLFPSYT